MSKNNENLINEIYMNSKKKCKPPNKNVCFACNSCNMTEMKKETTPDPKAAVPGSYKRKNW